MAKCPKCGHKLHLYNVSQFCPNCGVNMRFYGFEETFFREAKLAELSQAAVHIKLRRLQAALIGNKLCIARLVVALLPIAALLLPSGSAGIHLPLKEIGFDFGILGLVDLFTGQGFGYIMSMRQSLLAGGAFQALVTALFVYISVAVLGVIVLLSSILCFVSIKNMQKIISVFAGAGIVDSVAALIFIQKFASSAGAEGFVTGKAGFGLLLTVALFGAVIAINVILQKRGIPVKYAEGMERRAEIYKQYKAGKVNLDDLTQPVVETEETRKIDEEIRKEEEAHAAKKAKADQEKKAQANQEKKAPVGQTKNALNKKPTSDQKNKKKGGKKHG